MNTRYIEFDIMKGIGIMFMIIGHLTPYMTNVIFSFHMPLFFIVSGYFYKPANIHDSLKKDFKRLVIPYIATALIVIAYYLLLSIARKSDLVSEWIIAAIYGGSSSHDSIILANMPMIGAIWFLLALFWCKNIYNIIERNVTSPQKTFILCLIISLIAIIAYKEIISLPLSINQGLSALIFYNIGHQIRLRGGFENINKITVTILVILWIIAFIFSELYMVDCTFGILPLDILGAVGGTILIYYISKFVNKIKYLSKILAYVGINSLAFLCIHLIDLNAPTSWYFGIQSEFRVIYDIVFCFIIVFCFSRLKLTKRIYNIQNLR
jgi:fucose 4-O-acetylase-like acetyltransferase